MTEREKLMSKVQRYGFAVVEANLYLDSHPTCKHGLEYYTKNKALYDEAVAEYESKFAPINLPSDPKSLWKWSTTPFPWEYDANLKEDD